MKLNYFLISGLENIYLENSFLIELIESEHKIIFIIEFVLTEKHILYETPKNKEQYCYRKGNLIFDKIKKYNWKEKNLKKIPCVEGEESDYGNIDNYWIKNHLHFLSGDWGEIEIFTEYFPQIEFN